MKEEARREMPVPFGTKWYKVANVELKEIRGEWAFFYSGKVTPYEPRFATFRDFRKLKLPEEPKPEYPTPESDEAWSRFVKTRPPDSILEFFKKWGPLGFYYRDAVNWYYGAKEYDETEEWFGVKTGYHFSQYFDRRFSDGKTSASITADFDSGTMRVGHMGLEGYWEFYHTDDFDMSKTRTGPNYYDRFPQHEEVFNNYFENWIEAWISLSRVQAFCMEWEKNRDLQILNIRIGRTSLRPYVRPRIRAKGNEKKYQLTFGFTNLYDALVGLLGENVLGRVDMRICQNPDCGNPFDALQTGTYVYCSPKCQREGPDNRRLQDPVKKYRRMLKARLKRCPEELVSQEESKAINAELLQAKSIKKLKDIEEKKYPLILGKKKGSAK